MAQTYPRLDEELLIDSYALAAQSIKEFLQSQRRYETTVHVHKAPVVFSVGDRLHLAASKEPSDKHPAHSYSKRWGQLYADHTGTVVTVAPFGNGGGSCGYRQGVFGHFQEPQYLVRLDCKGDLGGSVCRDLKNWPTNHVRYVSIKRSTLITRLG